MKNLIKQWSCKRDYFDKVFFEHIFRQKLWPSLDIDSLYLYTRFFFLYNQIILVKIIHKRNKCELINQSISNKYNIFIFISWNHLVTSMTKIKHCDHFFGYKIYKLLFEKFVDIKGVIRSRKSKTKYNTKLAKRKRSNILHRKLKIEVKKDI
jgi:hypothetical protein